LNFIFSNKFAFSNNTKQLAAKIEKRIRTKKEKTAQLGRPGANGPADQPEKKTPQLLPSLSQTGGPNLSSPTSNYLPLLLEPARTPNSPPLPQNRNHPTSPPLQIPAPPLFFPLLSPSKFYAILRKFLTGVRGVRRRNSLVSTR
jgi:hypothetical protein